MIKKLIHMAVAGMILISVSGFTVNMHFCHNHLIDLALFSPAQSCCDKGGQETCHPGNQVSNGGHCVDKSLQVGDTDDYVATFFAFDFGTIANIDLLHELSTPYKFQGSQPILAGPAPRYKEPPPFREVDLSEIQTFLI